MNVSASNSSEFRITNVVENKYEQPKELSEQELAQKILDAAKAGKLEDLHELKKNSKFNEITIGELFLAQLEASKQGHRAAADFLKAAVEEKIPEMTPGKMLLAQYEISKLMVIKA
jgi:hypothetical protein